MLCSFRRWHLEMTKLPFRPKNKWLHGEALLGAIRNGGQCHSLLFVLAIFSPAKHSSEMDVYWFFVSSSLSFFLFFLNFRKLLQIWSQNTRHIYHSPFAFFLFFHLQIFFCYHRPLISSSEPLWKGWHAQTQRCSFIPVHLTDTSTVADWWPWQLCCQEKWQVYS